MILPNDLLKSAVQYINLHKSRSALTILGIVIGVMAVTIVVSFGKSAEGLLTNEIQSFGPENVFINPGKPSDGVFQQQSSSFLLKTLTRKDLEKLNDSSFVPDAFLVNPSTNATYLVSYDKETVSAMVIGSGAEAFSIYRLSPRNGRFFTNDEVQSRAFVAVIGKNVVKDLFGSEKVNPVGERVKIKEKKFRIVGVFSYEGSSSFGIDDMVMIPYTTSQEYLSGTNHFQEIAVQAKNKEAVPNMVRDIKETLRESHDIKEGQEDDFIVSTQDDIINTVNNTLGAISTFLSFVAGISLIVGGIGVMNIMFVSVNERTREIGLRKAIGARYRDVLQQFLLESVFLTLGGGIAGVILGFLTTYALTYALSLFTSFQFPFVFSVSASLLGVGIALFIGVFFGVFPALQAAKKSPMEALRYE